jgi:hypothetical protein
VLAAHSLLQPARTVILGDWLDCGAWSSHPKQSVEDRAEAYHEDEIQPCRRLLSRLEEHTGELVYIAGNHEHRVERKILELGDLGAGIASLVDPGRLLGEGRKPGWRYVPYTRKAGTPLPHYRIAEDLIAVHGWSFARHAAAKHLEIARGYSVVHGHTHRMQSFTERDPIEERTVRAWSPGCLAQLQPPYMSHQPANSVHGFSLVYCSNDRKSWTEYTVEIRDGVCHLPGGQKVDGRKFAKDVRALEAGS